MAYLASVVAAVVLWVHFVPGDQTETMGVIYRTYDRGGRSPVAGALAVLNVALIVGGLIALIGLADRLRQLSRRDRDQPPATRRQDRPDPTVDGR